MSLGGSSFDGGNAGGDFDAPPAASLAHQLGPAIAAAEELYGMDSETAALVLAPTRPEEDAFAAVISGTAGVEADLASYEQICDERVRALAGAERGTAAAAAAAERRSFGLERNTWLLIKLLYTAQDRLNPDPTVVKGLGTAAVIAAGDEGSRARWGGMAASDRVTVDQVMGGDSRLRQSDLVTRWLEDVAGHDLVAADFLNHRGDWPQTLSHRKRNQAAQGGSAEVDASGYVMELDPDAPNRTGGAIHPDDAAKEATFLRALWRLVRAGRLQEATRFCRKNNQPWRAASLSGGVLAHDPTAAGEVDPAEGLPLQGNANRRLWKQMCYALSADDAFSPDERAVYATLAGNLDAILPVCASWEDFVWAYFRVGVDAAVDAELSRVGGGGGGGDSDFFNPLPPRDLDANIIFANVEKHVVGLTDEAFHSAQRLVILGEIDGLFAELDAKWLADGAPSDPHLLRFAAHLAIFCRAASVAHPYAHAVSILGKYVDYLIAVRQTDHVARYAFYLPPEQQVAAYARFLEGVHDSTEREHCLALARAAGLDVRRITKTVVETIRMAPGADGRSMLAMTSSGSAGASLLASGGGSGGGGGGGSAEDEAKLRSIEWLCFDPSQRSEALFQANALLRYWIHPASRNYDAARKLVAQLPDNTRDVALAANTPRDCNAVFEFDCYHQFLNATLVYSQWLAQLGKRPVKPLPEKLVKYSDELRYEQKLQEFEREQARWLADHTQCSTNLVNIIIDGVLRFEGGWLLYPNEEAPSAEFEARCEELETLRRQCVPPLTFTAHHVLTTADRHDECLRLADVIAGSDHNLWEVFSDDELKRFLRLLRESSIALLSASAAATTAP